MMLILQWKFSILDPNIRIIRIHIFLILVVLIYDITTVIYQYCNGPSNKKFLWNVWTLAVLQIDWEPNKKTRNCSSLKTKTKKEKTRNCKSFRALAFFFHAPRPARDWLTVDKLCPCPCKSASSLTYKVGIRRNQRVGTSLQKTGDFTRSSPAVCRHQPALPLSNTCTLTTTQQFNSPSNNSFCRLRNSYSQRAGPLHRATTHYFDVDTTMHFLLEPVGATNDQEQQITNVYCSLPTDLK